MKIACYILFVFSMFFVRESNKKNIILFDSFEDESFKRKWPSNEGCCEYSISTVDSLSKTGNKSVRFELNNTDPIIGNGKRAELLLFSEKSSNIERWYRFDVYLPENYQNDPLFDIIAQWHETPDFDLGETWRSPPIALMTRKNFWELRILWADKPVNTNKTISGSKLIPLGNYEKNKWVEWVFHIKYSYGDDGLMEIWKNKKKVLEHQGPNYYNDKKGPFFKFGIYKPDWMTKTKNLAVTKRVLFFDNVAIGNNKANKKLMRSLR